MEEDMKTRRIAVVILLALVLAALLPLSAAAQATMIYVYGQVRAMAPGQSLAQSEGYAGAQVEVWYEGRLIRTATTKSAQGDFGFGLSPVPGAYQIKINVGTMTPQEVYLGDKLAFTPSPDTFGFRLGPGAPDMLGPIVFLVVKSTPPQPVPNNYYIHGAVRTALGGPGVSGVQVTLERKVGTDADPGDAVVETWVVIGTKATGDRGFYGFGISGIPSWYRLSTNASAAPTFYLFVLPQNPSSILPPGPQGYIFGPFDFILLP